MANDKYPKFFAPVNPNDWQLAKAIRLDCDNNIYYYDNSLKMGKEKNYGIYEIQKDLNNRKIKEIFKEELPLL